MAVQYFDFDRQSCFFSLILILIVSYTRPEWSNMQVSSNYEGIGLKKSIGIQQMACELA